MTKFIDSPGAQSVGREQTDARAPNSSSIPSLGLFRFNAAYLPYSIAFGIGFFVLTYSYLSSGTHDSTGNPAATEFITVTKLPDTITITTTLREVSTTMTLPDTITITTTKLREIVRTTKLPETSRCPPCDCVHAPCPTASNLIINERRQVQILSSSWWEEQATMFIRVLMNWLGAALILVLRHNLARWIMGGSSDWNLVGRYMWINFMIATGVGIWKGVSLVGNCGLFLGITIFDLVIGFLLLEALGIKQGDRLDSSARLFFFVVSALAAVWMGDGISNHTVSHIIYLCLYHLYLLHIRSRTSRLTPTTLTDRSIEVNGACGTH